MIKICIDARMINSSGIGTYLRNIVKHLDRKIFYISLIINSKISEIEDYKKYRLIYCDVPIYSIKEQIVLPFIIPSCDIFWSPHFNIPIFPIRAKRRIVNIHDLYHMAYYDSLSWKEKIYAKIVIFLTVKESDRVITCSKFSKNELIKYFPISKNKTEVIYYGVNKQQFLNNSNKEEVNLILSKYTLKSRYFLFVGNLKKHKNLSGLIKAFDLFSKKAKGNCDLVLIGKKEGLKNCVDISSRESEDSLTNKIHVLSDVSNEELPIIYSGAVALMYPSFYEGFGFPPLEAMCAKTPVISSNAASLPEVCGNAVLYIDPNNIEDIASNMLALFSNEDERQKYIDLGEKQKEKFSWEKSVKLHEALFERIVNEDSSSS